MQQLSNLLPPCVYNHCTDTDWQMSSSVATYLFHTLKELSLNDTSRKPALFSGQSPSLVKQGTMVFWTSEGLLLYVVSQQTELVELILDWVCT